MIPQGHDKRLPPLTPGQSTPTIGDSIAVPRQKKNSTACQPCKQAKRKCSGPPSPCQACRVGDSECVFDESLDLRRRVAIRRTIGELQDSRNYYRDLLHSLLASLRSSDPNRVEHLLDLIRSSASLPDIAAVTADAPVILNDAQTADSTYRRSSGDRRSSDDIFSPQSVGSFVDSHSQVTLDMLCDIPLFQVPAKPWTAVTDDDHLISHLISLYFTWDHPFSQLVDQDIFLAEMAKGDLASNFCTPFIVNSMLAVASAYSDFPKVFAVPGDMNTRGQHFYLEAERLWKAEEGNATLLNIQGVILMSCVLKYEGKERSSWLMLKQAVQLARDFGMFQPRDTVHHNWNEMPAGMNVTAWGLSILNAQMSLEMRTTADLMLPVARPYATDDLDGGVMWSPYPRTNQISYVEKPALLRYMINELANLTGIVVDIEDLLFDRAFDIGIDGLWSAADGIYSRIRMCLEFLPDALRIEDQPLPQALFVRIKYHQGAVELFSGLLEYLGDTSPACSDQARTIRLHSAKEIARLLRIQRQCYGLKQIPCHMIDAVHSTLPTLLAELGDNESKEALGELCRFLVAFRRRIKSADNIIQMIERTASESDVELPPETGAVLNLDLTPSNHPGSDSHW